MSKNPLSVRLLNKILAIRNTIVEFNNIIDEENITKNFEQQGIVLNKIDVALQDLVRYGDPEISLMNANSIKRNAWALRLYYVARGCSKDIKIYINDYQRRAASGSSTKASLVKKTCATLSVINVTVEEVINYQN